MRRFLAMTAMGAGMAMMLGAAHPAPLPKGAVVLPGGKAKALLHQCSRSTPASFGGTWQPRAADIARLEAILPGAITGEQAKKGGRFRMDAFAPDKWNRQYVGLIRHGRRYIYGNFFPVTGDKELEARWRTEPMIICDGGPSFFGVEYDVRARKVTQVAFNGRA